MTPEQGQLLFDQIWSLVLQGFFIGLTMGLTCKILLKSLTRKEF